MKVSGLFLLNSTRLRLPLAGRDRVGTSGHLGLAYLPSRGRGGESQEVFGTSQQKVHIQDLLGPQWNAHKRVPCTPLC